METVHNLIFLDIAVAVLFTVLGNLSMRLGGALKIPPYYRLFYVAVILIGLAAAADVLGTNLSGMVRIPKVISMALRCIAGLLAIPASLRYWKWLFSEHFSS